MLNWNLTPYTQLTENQCVSSTLKCKTLKLLEKYKGTSSRPRSKWRVLDWHQIHKMGACKTVEI
jgi:hypothetical protein